MSDAFPHIDQATKEEIATAIETYQVQFQNKIDLCIFLHQGELSNFLADTIRSDSGNTHEVYEWNDTETTNNNFSKLDALLAPASAIFWEINQDMFLSQLANIKTWIERKNRQLLRGSDDADAFNPSIYVSVRVSDPTVLPIGDIQRTATYIYNHELTY